MIHCCLEFILLWIILSLKSCSAKDEIVRNFQSVLEGSTEKSVNREDNTFSALSYSCIPIMCGLSLSKLLESPELNITEALQPGLCSQLVVKVDLFGESLESLRMGERISRGLRIIRAAAPKNLPVILNIIDSHNNVSFQHLLKPTAKQDAFTSAIVRLMTFNNLAGIHLNLGRNSYSMGYPELDNEILSFVKYYSQLCLANNWKFDASLTYPFTNFLSRHSVNVISTYVRYLFFSFDSSNSVLHTHTFPLHGDGFSIEDLIKTLDEGGVDIKNVAMDIPFYSRVLDISEVNESSSSPVNKLPQGLYFNTSKHSYAFVCEKIRYELATFALFKDDLAHSYFLQNTKQRLAFESPFTINEKIQYVLSAGVKTVLINDVYDDDIKGQNCGHSYPLLRSVAQAIKKKARCRSEHQEETNGEIPLSTESYTVISFVIACLVFVICMLFLCCCYLKRQANKTKSKRKDKTKNHMPEIPLQLKDMEISCHEFTLGKRETKPSQVFNFIQNISEPNNVLGQGYFNIVVKGRIDSCAVAVKVPKQRFATNNHMTLQIKELEILHEVRGHQNIIELLAFSSVQGKKGIKVYTFLEYCPMGSLDKYLKLRRDTFINIGDDDEDVRILHKSNIQIDTTEILTVSDFDETISTKTLMSWACQICDGMEFLASKQVVHGDLAARNILLESVEKIKICDFGSACKMNSVQDSNSPRNEEAVPWRWMAVELLEKNQVSRTSDVWSYGVTLWEIFSLGEVPYAGLHYDSDFVNKLKSGIQLAAPRYATNDIYENVMQPCWTIDHEDRSTFTNIKDHLLQSIHSIFSKGYEDVSRQQLTQPKV